MPDSQPTITIIDDDESVRRALQRMIKSLGFHVDAFATSEEFLQGILDSNTQAGTAVPHSAHCLILDVHLPGLSGLDLQKQLNAEGHGIPIIFVTAYPDDQARQQAMNAGAIAFLYKPFDQQVLLDAVHKGLAEGRATIS